MKHQSNLFADRIADVPRSFIREILKVALDPTVISFAGGLPNREYFPLEALRSSTNAVFDRYGSSILQYSNSEGLPALRARIAERYRHSHDLDIPVERILITSGSQQGLDLLAKTIVNEGDALIIEEPGYLGAIQAFSIYRPELLPVPVSHDGIDIELLESLVRSRRPKLMYAVPNFQNPSGISYSYDNRHDVARVLTGARTYLIEDDPYGELRFEGVDKPSFMHLIPDNTILLGSFSKTVVPGFRLGWIVAPEEIMGKLIVAKQATDLHTSHFTQAIVDHYLEHNDIKTHLRTVRSVYGSQCRAMQDSIRRHFPDTVSHTRPEGGMFLWATLPERMAALDLFEIAAKDRVVFVPGDPFYVGKTRMNTMRLNFSCVDEPTIEEGIKRLGAAIGKLEEEVSDGR